MSNSDTENEDYKPFNHFLDIEEDDREFESIRVQKIKAWEPDPRNRDQNLLRHTVLVARSSPGFVTAAID